MRQQPGGQHHPHRSARRLTTPYLQQLVLNPQAEHYRKIKGAVWLLLYLLLNCGSNTWILVREIDDIACQMGLNPQTIRRWLNVLQQQEYILLKGRGNEQFIHLKGIANCLISPRNPRP